MTKANKLKADFNSVSRILQMGDELQTEANKNDIIHVFDDGGYRELVLLKMFNLTTNVGRHGDDAIDINGKLYELKTVNLIDTKGELRNNPGITTCHHMNHVIIHRYRNVEGFIIGIFYYHAPARIYFVEPSNLEIFFSAWESRLNNEGLEHLNNPKMSFQHVITHGELLYHNEKFDPIFEAMPKPRVSNKKIKTNPNQFSLFD